MEDRQTPAETQERKKWFECNLISSCDWSISSVIVIISIVYSTRKPGKIWGFQFWCGIKLPYLDKKTNTRIKWLTCSLIGRIVRLEVLNKKRASCLPNLDKSSEALLKLRLVYFFHETKQNVVYFSAIVEVRDRGVVTFPWSAIAKGICCWYILHL